MPVDRFSFANDISPTSKSFVWIDNEEQLLARDWKTLVWLGTWGRNRIHDQYGQGYPVTDGTWIIEFGTFGWLGYFSLFGLLALAAFRSSGRLGTSHPASVTISGLALLLCVNVVDMLPSNNLTPLTLLVAGSIANASAGSCARPSNRPSRTRDLDQAPATAAE